MSRNMRTVLVVALLISLACTALVYAERGNGRFGDQLTEEQREAIHAKVQEMREAGASREEIHAAIREALEGYGITPPEGRPEGRREGRGPGGRFSDQLTEEQREAIHAKVREMREAGASGEEIHAAMREMFAEFGIDLPDCAEAGKASSPAGNLGDSPGEGKRWGEIKGRFE